MNVVSFQVHPEGPQAMGWFKKEIRTFDDIKGQRYRIYGIGAETYSKLGIATVALAGGEIVPALERGAIDGAEWVNCSDDKILGHRQDRQVPLRPGHARAGDGGRVHHQQGQVGRAARRPEGDRQDLRPGVLLEPLRPVPGEDGQGLCRRCSRPASRSSRRATS